MGGKCLFGDTILFFANLPETMGVRLFVLVLPVEVYRDIVWLTPQSRREVSGVVLAARARNFCGSDW